MSDEELLRILAEAVRAEDRARDPRWEKLTRGEVGEAEPDVAGEPSPSEARVLGEIHRPFDAATRARFQDRVLAQVAADRVERTERADLAKRGAAPVVQLASRRARFFRFGAVAAVPLAAAAALLLQLRTAPRELALPAYDAVVVTGDVATRSEHADVAPSALARVSGARFELVLRPQAPLTAPVDAHAFLIRDGKARAWRAPVDVSPDGAVRIAGPVRALFDEPSGVWEAAVAIGPKGAAAPSPDAVEKTANTNRAISGFVVVRARFVVAPSAN